jgi:4-hydroxybenzoate polyprenyltransferase
VTSPVREGQTFAGESLLVRYVNFVKLPHTLFALPFALLGVLAAARVERVTLRTVMLVVLAFSAARWAAMGFNRVADRRFDAANPRTRNRELPRGALTLGQAWLSIVAAAGLFVTAAARLNPLCLALSPVALAWVLTYSLAKRFTWWPHLWLGASLAIAPVGGYLAVTGRWSQPAWLLLAVTVAVATWVAGFDIFYALPDAGFDRDQGRRSAVVRLGEARAILLA